MYVFSLFVKIQKLFRKFPYFGKGNYVDYRLFAFVLAIFNPCNRQWKISVSTVLILHQVIRIQARIIPTQWYDLSNYIFRSNFVWCVLLSAHNNQDHGHCFQILLVFERYNHEDYTKRSNCMWSNGCHK